MRHSDAELFKEKIEVSLDSRQIFYLFFGGAVIASLVFVLGVMVGKRLEARAHVETEAATSATNDPLAALDELSAEADELAFPAALAGDPERADAPLGPVDEVLAARAEEQAKAEAEAEQAKAEAAAKAKAERKAAREKAARERAERENRAEREEAEAEAEPEAEPEEAKFTLQLSSFRDRSEADAFFKELEDGGYAPYMLTAEVDDQTWYRVRLGRYASYQDAIDAKKRFEADRHIIAYVTRL